MWFIALAVLLGVAAGKLRGGSSLRVADHEIRWVTLLVAGLAARLLNSGLGLDGASIPLVVSFVLLGAFAWGNLRLVGMPIFLFGLTLNFVPMLVNGGMPVRGDAVVAAQVASAADLDAVDLGAGRHLETDGDSLTFLGDIVPVPFLREVVSFGDLILAAGLADVVANLMLPGRRRRDRLPEHRDSFDEEPTGQPIVGDLLSVPPVDDISGEVDVVPADEPREHQPDPLPVFDDLIADEEPLTAPVITSLRVQPVDEPEPIAVDDPVAEPEPHEEPVDEPVEHAAAEAGPPTEPLRVFDFEAEQPAEAQPAQPSGWDRPLKPWDSPDQEPQWAGAAHAEHTGHEAASAEPRSVRASLIDLVAEEAAEVLATRRARALDYESRTSGTHRAADG